MLQVGHFFLNFGICGVGFGVWGRSFGSRFMVRGVKGLAVEGSRLRESQLGEYG